MNSIFEFDVTPRTEAPPLHHERLACGGTIAAPDVRIRRRSDWPDRAMRRINVAFWLLFWGLGASIVAVSLAVLS